MKGFKGEKKIETVNVKVDGRIAFLELNRPEALNALNLIMFEELASKLAEIRETDTDILIIHGNGKVFSAGGDIKIMVNEMDQPTFYQVMDKINEMVKAIYSMPKLVISAVHGAAAGLGFSIALAADYIVADKATIFAMNFIKIGLVPDGGGHYFLSKRLGESKAKQLIWEGKNLIATEALELGLINQVVEGDSLASAKEKAKEWLNMPISAMLQTKSIYLDSGIEELARIVELEKINQFKMRNSANHKEGISAFLEKRNPIFNGK